MGFKKRFCCQITSLNPEVTGSCHLVTINYPDGRKSNFIVDCGLYQEKAYNELNHKQFPFKGEHIEFVLITHNHADHMGRLPYLVSEGFEGWIYASGMTSRLMSLALRDSFKILREDAKKHNKKLLYDEEDLEETLSRIEPCKFNEVEYVDRNIKVTFFMNGHLLGAAMILVQISYPGEKDINLFFTGDYKPQNLFFEVMELPEWVLGLPLTIITEATYGYMNTFQVSYHMESDLEKAIQEGKTVLITVFAQGRAQEILYMLQDMQKHGKISTKIPIKLDGNLAQEYTGIYRYCDLLIDSGKDDFLPENFGYVSKEDRQNILENRSQQIILTTSGMADHGPAQIYLENFVERRDVLIYIPGYTSPDTLGYKLQYPVDGKITFNGKEHQMNAQVMTTSEWSSHAKADEIIEFLQQFKNLNMVLINHGQIEVKEQFAERVGKEVFTKNIGILGEYTYRICCYGYMKHMGSKLIFPDLEQSKLVEARKKEDIKRTKKSKQPFVRKHYKR